MRDRQRRWARLLPDHRTLYVSLHELDAHRGPGESDADILLRSIRFAHEVVDADPAVRERALEIARTAGVPEEDPLGYELALALVVRARFLQAHPHTLLVTVSEDEDAGPGEPGP